MRNRESTYYPRMELVGVGDAVTLTRHLTAAAGRAAALCVEFVECADHLDIVQFDRSSVLAGAAALLEPAQPLYRCAGLRRVRCLSVSTTQSAAGWTVGTRRDVPTLADPGVPLRPPGLPDTPAIHRAGQWASRNRRTASSITALRSSAVSGTSTPNNWGQKSDSLTMPSNCWAASRGSSAVRTPSSSSRAM